MLKTNRSTEIEIMDSDDYSDDELRGDFNNIRRANMLTGVYSSLTRIISEYIKKHNLDHITILDAGTGMADIPKMLMDHFNQNGTSMKIKGIDPNPRAIEIAKRFVNNHRDIEFEARSIQDLELEDKYDFVICNHTLHHIPDQDIIESVNKMHSMARYALIIGDVRRTPLALFGAKIASLFISNRLTSNDTPLSIARALSSAELKQLIRKSSIESYSLRFTFPYRYILTASGNGA